VFQTLKGSLQTYNFFSFIAKISRVSNPQRIATNDIWSSSAGASDSVSNPQRIATNIPHLLKLDLSLRVSNPQRIATNATVIPKVIEIPTLFQTLKGSLQTDVSLDQFPQYFMFQTLKGSLQTEEEKRETWKKSLFQTLKGSLQTQSCFVSLHDNRPVSNPQRIATNPPHPLLYFTPQIRVSNPQRIATNPA